MVIIVCTRGWVRYVLALEEYNVHVSQDTYISKTRQRVTRQKVTSRKLDGDAAAGGSGTVRDA